MLILMTNDTATWRGRNVITYVDINLFESPAQTLVNTVNTVGVMGKGIALIFKRLYPQMFEKYKQLCQQKKLDVGMLYVYRTPNKIVVNFPTKKHWRNPSQLEYIEAGLKKFVATYQDYGISSVAFPQLGCGHGELNWETQVQPLMERYLEDLPIPVYIHIYTKSPDFVPERLDSEFARTIRMERQQVSVSQLWTDLRDKLGTMTPYQLSPGVTVMMDDEHIFFDTGATEPVILYHEDIADLWSILRRRGTLHEEYVPQTIIDSNAVGYLFDLLKHLPYIRPISLRLRNEGVMVTVEGLQYIPSPVEAWEEEGVIFV